MKKLVLMLLLQEAELDGLACCAGSCGPGHVHLINGVYDAHRGHAPMLVIASTINTNEMGMDYFQETNTIKLFDDCSVYNQMIMTLNRHPEFCRQQFSMLFLKRSCRCRTSGRCL